MKTKLEIIEYLIKQHKYFPEPGINSGIQSFVKWFKSYINHQNI